jgi:hypothetical protein
MKSISSEETTVRLSPRLLHSVLKRKTKKMERRAAAEAERVEVATVSSPRRGSFVSSYEDKIFEQICSLNG